MKRLSSQTVKFLQRAKTTLSKTETSFYSRQALQKASKGSSTSVKIHASIVRVFLLMTKSQPSQ